jgi:hypothetical protein
MPPRQVVVPKDPTVTEVPEENQPVMTLTKEVKTFLSYAKYPYILRWDPANLFVGRIISGGQIGSGTISFQPVEGAQLTFYNKYGAVVENGSPAVFQGGGGTVICTAKTATSVTLRAVTGEFGSPQLQFIPEDFVGTAQNQPGVTEVISYSTSAVEYDFDPAVFSPLGYTRRLSQVGPGTLKLSPHSNAVVTFITPTNNTVDEYTIEQGQHVTVICVAQTVANVTLQLIF